jgi:DNA-binding IscR family transcriptional regulator
MTHDLRVNDTFFVGKDIFFNPKVSRKARAVYITLCFLTTLEQRKFDLKNISVASGYNTQIVSRALKELNELGFVKRTRDHIDLVI